MRPISINLISSLTLHLPYRHLPLPSLIFTSPSTHPSSRLPNPIFHHPSLQVPLFEGPVPIHADLFQAYAASLHPSHVDDVTSRNRSRSGSFADATGTENRRSSFGQLLQGLSEKYQGTKGDTTHGAIANPENTTTTTNNNNGNGNTNNNNNNNNNNNGNEGPYSFLRLAPDGASILLRLANPLSVDLCGLSDLQHVKAQGGPGR